MVEKKLSIQFTDPLLEILPPSECDRSVWTLQLSTRARNSLARLGIISVGQLIRAAKHGTMAPRAAGLGTVADLESSLQALSQSVGRDGCIDWDRYFDNRRRYAANSKRRLPRVISAKPYPLQLNSPSLDSLMPLWRRSLIDVLHPSHRASNCFQQMGVNSVGALVDIARRGAKDVPGAGPATIAEIDKLLHALSQSVQNDGSVDLVAYAAARGFAVLPEKVSSELTLADFLKVFPEAATTAVESRYHFAGSFVLRHYLFGDVRRPPSLEKVARRLNWTKQGIALLKDKIVTMLKRSILDDSYVGCRFRFRPAFVTPLRQLRAALSVAGHSPRLYSEWQQTLALVWGITPTELGSLESCFFSLLDYHFVHPRGSRFEPIILPKSTNTSPFTAALPRAERLLTYRFPKGLSEEQLVEKLRRSVGRNLTSKEIPVIINAIAGTEHVKSEGRFRVRLERVIHLADQLERILQEKRLPMHIRELTAQVRQSRGKSGGRRTVKHISSSLSYHERFKPVGRTGYWILSGWNGFTTESVADVAAKILQESKRPMTEVELYPLISARRSVVPETIRSVLRRDGRFHRVAPRTWELK